MNKGIRLLGLLLCAVLCLTSCQGSTPSAGENAALSAAQDVTASEVSDNLLHFCHRQIRDDLTLYLYTTEDYTVAEARLQNLTTGEIDALPVKDFYFSGRDVQIRAAEDHFYLFSSTDCAVYALDGKLLKTIDIPADSVSLGIPVFCLSEDLSKIAYVRQTAENGAQLVTRVLDSGVETVVTTLDAGKSMHLSFITSLGFSKDGSILGFFGGTNPDPAQTSVECYGRIHTDGSDLKIIAADKTAVRFFGGSMFVYDSNYGIQEAKTGKVTVYRFAEDEAIVVETQNSAESEFVYPYSETDFVTMLPQENSAVLTVYENGKASVHKEITFASETERNYNTGSTVFASYSPKSKTILLDGYQQSDDLWLPHLYVLEN